ncbi:MAG TPA: DUF308 domain-containing protein [Gemmataceae bacterium]|nr:DUF308 domain-containing protein [Gemmataceae bacterium]
MGIIIMAVGTAAIAYSFLATLTTVLLFGYLLLAGGIVQIVNAFLGRGWRAFFLHIVVGLLQIVVGGFMIERPLLLAEFLTLLLAVSLIVGGGMRIVFAIVESFSGKGWVLLNGLVSLLLGISIWRQWPEASLWVIGLFVGIDLIFNGWSWVMLGLLVKSVPRPAT